MLKTTIENALNEQMNAEMYSSYLYLSMAAYFEDKGLNGFGKWMHAQAQEEMLHAMKLYRFVQERGGRVLLKEIKQPQTEWESPLAAVKAVLAHEQLVTGLIHGLVELAHDEKDYPTSNFLIWFVDEQVEEEDSAGGVLSQLELIGGEGNALFIMDRELGQRQFITMDRIMGVAQK